MPPLTSLISLLGLDYLRGNFAARVTAAPVDLWSLLSKYNDRAFAPDDDSPSQFELHGGQKITHLSLIRLSTYSPSPFFSALMLVTRHTFVSRMDDDPPAWHALFVTRRQCKNPRSSRVFFPDGISSSELDLWTGASPPSDHKAPDVSVIQQWKRFNVINDDDRKPLTFSSLPIYIGRNKRIVGKNNDTIK